jgi:hypothetical protein
LKRMVSNGMLITKVWLFYWVTRFSHVDVLPLTVP